MKSLFVVITLTVLNVVTVARAGEMPMKGQYVNLKPDSTCTKVQDVEGHVICTFELPWGWYSRRWGILLSYCQGNWDYVKGEGTAQGYTISTFAEAP